MRIFSSILPFTNRFGLRWATCMTNGGGAIGGFGGKRLIRPCPIWENCSFCTQTALHQYPPSENHLIPLNCPRCGGEFEMGKDELGIKVKFPALGDQARIFISGKIARHNLRRHVNSSISPCHVSAYSMDEGCLRLSGLGVPFREELMGLVLQGLGYLSDRSKSQYPLVTEEGRWAFLMACSYSSDAKEVESLIRGLEEKALVRLPSETVGSVVITEKGRERYKELVGVMCSSHQENQGG